MITLSPIRAKGGHEVPPLYVFPKFFQILLRNLSKTIFVNNQYLITLLLNPVWPKFEHCMSNGSIWNVDLTSYLLCKFYKMIDFEQNPKNLKWLYFFQFSMMWPNLLAQTYWIAPLRISKESWTQNISYKDFGGGAPGAPPWPE